MQKDDNTVYETIYLHPSPAIVQAFPYNVNISDDGRKAHRSDVKSTIRAELCNDTGLAVVWDHTNGVGLLIGEDGFMTYLVTIAMTENKMCDVQANLLAAHKEYLATGIIPSDLGIEVLKPKIPKPTTKPAAGGITASSSEYVTVEGHGSSAAVPTSKFQDSTAITPTTTTQPAKPNPIPHSTGCTLAPGTTCAACGHTA